MKFVRFYRDIVEKYNLDYAIACETVFANIKQAIYENILETGECDIKGFGKFYISERKLNTVHFKFDDRVTDLINDRISFRVRQDLDKKD